MHCWAARIANQARLALAVPRQARAAAILAAVGGEAPIWRCEYPRAATARSRGAHAASASTTSELAP